MIRTRMKSVVVLLMLLVMCSTFTEVSFAAEPPDLSRSGSIAVTLREVEQEHKVVTGAVFRLYKVADAVMDGYLLTFDKTEPFENSNISLEDLSAENLAVHLDAYAKEQSIAYATGRADDAGTVKFDGLTTGLYLLSQDGNAEGYYATVPFLVSIPMTDQETGSWLYDIEANPKVEAIPERPEDFTSRTVEKIWTGSGAETPDHITVALMKNGELYETVKLSADNNWSYTWEKLPVLYRWEVVELQVPSGYRVSYHHQGTKTLIQNTYQPSIPTVEELTVKKVWDDRDSGKRPASITVELLCGDRVYDTVELRESMSWTYTWTELEAGKTWSVREVNVPAGYQVEYSVDGTNLVITNSALPPLIQTGQLNWPVPVMAGLGVLLFALGWIMRSTKRHEKK